MGACLYKLTCAFISLLIHEIPQTYIAVCNYVSLLIPCVFIQVEKSFLQNEGGYRDGLELQKGRKQGLVTQESHTELHDTIPMSLL